MATTQKPHPENEDIAWGPFQSPVHSREGPVCFRFVDEKLRL